MPRNSGKACIQAKAPEGSQKSPSAQARARVDYVLRDVHRSPVDVVSQLLRLRRVRSVSVHLQGAVPAVRGWNASGARSMVRRLLGRAAWPTFTFGVAALCAAIITLAATGNL